MSAVDDDLERRLENWGRWRRGGLDYAQADTSGDTFDGYGSGSRGYRETRMPTLAGEAIDTDRSVMRLVDELQRVVFARYARLLPRQLGLGGFVHAPSYFGNAEIASWLSCSERTFERRLQQARARLIALLNFCAM